MRVLHMYEDTQKGVIRKKEDYFDRMSRKLTGITYHGKDMIVDLDGVDHYHMLDHQYSIDRLKGAQFDLIITYGLMRSYTEVSVLRPMLMSSKYKKIIKIEIK